MKMFDSTLAKDIHYTTSVGLTMTMDFVWFNLLSLSVTILLSNANLLKLKFARQNLALATKTTK